MKEYQKQLNQKKQGRVAAGPKLAKNVKKSFLKRGNSILDAQSSLNSILKKHSSLSNICKLCSQAYPENQMDSFGECGHFFCHFCALKYCIYNISIKKVVLCAEEGCGSELRQESELFKKLPQKSQSKYTEFLLTNPENHHVFKACPTDKCKGKIDITLEQVKCSSCHHIYCKDCLLPTHDGVDCNENFHKKFQNWQLCPVCKVPTEQNQDSNKATCPRKHSFCNVCRNDWEQAHQNCQVYATEVQKYTKRFERHPRWRNLLLFGLMIPVFPVYSASLLVLGVPTILIYSVIIGAKCFYNYFQNFKTSSLGWALMFCLLALIQRFKDLVGTYLNIMKGLLYAKKKDKQQ